ncbi:hypothetical protein MMC18_002629 [Xylographa bjoerkii]|nr:hypothetical protein [Xylographa bjoerkii]
MQLTPRIPDLIVGVDFGMTATGVVYFDDNGLNSSVSKIPTVLLYQKQADGQDTVLKWGLEAETAGATSCMRREWFKILLHIGYLELNQSREVIAHAEVKKWITDYLRCLYYWIHIDCETWLGKDWSQLEVVFAFAVPDLWPLEDRVALTNFNACIHDAGFLTGGPGHRLLVHTEAVAAASSFIRFGPGITLDIAVCRTQTQNDVPRFTSTQAVGSIMGVGGINYLMKLETGFRHKLQSGLLSTASALTWAMIRQRVRQRLNMSSCIELSLYHAHLPLQVQLSDLSCIELSPLEIDGCIAAIASDIASKLCQTIERDGGAELSHISHVFVAGGFGCSPVFLKGVQQWKESSANASIRSATLTRSIQPRMEVAIGLVDMVRNDFSFEDCTLSLKSRSGVCAADLVNVHGGPQPFQKRIKCDKNTVFKVRCTRTSKFDVLGNRVSGNYELPDVEIEVPKTSMFGKGMKVSGVADADEVTLSY